LRIVWGYFLSNYLKVLKMNFITKLAFGGGVAATVFQNVAKAAGQPHRHTPTSIQQGIAAFVPSTLSKMIGNLFKTDSSVRGKIAPILSSIAHELTDMASGVIHELIQESLGKTKSSIIDPVSNTAASGLRGISRGRLKSNVSPSATRKDINLEKLDPVTLASDLHDLPQENSLKDIVKFLYAEMKKLKQEFSEDFERGKILGEKQAEELFGSENERLEAHTEESVLEEIPPLPEEYEPYLAEEHDSLHSEECESHFSDEHEPLRSEEYESYLAKEHDHLRPEKEYESHLPEEHDHLRSEKEYESDLPEEHDHLRPENDLHTLRRKSERRPFRSQPGSQKTGTELAEEEMKRNERSQRSMNSMGTR
jgi:hypothetical protein